MSYKRVARKFRIILIAIQQWIREHIDPVSKVYLVPETDLVTLYVTARTREYDFELRRVLTDLVVPLRLEGHSIRGSQIPEGTLEELHAFFNAHDAIIFSTQGLQAVGE